MKPFTMIGEAALYADWYACTNLTESADLSGRAAAFIATVLCFTMACDVTG